MKKLFLVLNLTALSVFGDNLLLKAPFIEAKIELNKSWGGKLVIPPLVSDASYREAIMQDCKQYEEILIKYGSRLSNEELTEMVTEPLPYSMKKRYEVEVVFPARKTFKLKDQGEVTFEYGSLSPALDRRDTDLLKDVLNPQDGIRWLESHGTMRIQFTRRDQFCSYLNENLWLKTGSEVFWKLNDKDHHQINHNLKLLTGQVGSVLNLEDSNKRLAAMTGLAIYEVLKNSEFKSAKNFATVDYAWSVLFVNEESLQKSDVWNYTGNGVFQQQDSAFIELRGLE